VQRIVIAIVALGVAGIASAQGPLFVLEPRDQSGRITYFIADGVEGSAFRPADRDLAVWAIKQWEHALNGALRFEPSAEHEAIVRVFWVPSKRGGYGETRAFEAGALHGAAVFIRPDVDALDPEIAAAARRDPLMRDTIVYMTCLHELGHALGLNHSLGYGDVMYSFGFGGDVPGFFDRYRSELRTRDDIAARSGLTSRDIARARALYKRPANVSTQ
jgi:matrixin